MRFIYDVAVTVVASAIVAGITNFVGAALGVDWGVLWAAAVHPQSMKDEIGATLLLLSGACVLLSVFMAVRGAHNFCWARRNLEEYRKRARTESYYEAVVEQTDLVADDRRDVYPSWRAAAVWLPVGLACATLGYILITT